MNFWKVLQANPEKLIAAIARTPRTEAEYNNCKAASEDLLEWARRFYIHSQLGFIGSGVRCDGGVSKSRLARKSVSDEKHLWAIAQRIQSVQFLLQDVSQTIAQFDSPTTLFYCDPPYVHDVRGSKDNRVANPVKSPPRRQYRHEMSDDDHTALAKLLYPIQGKAIVSGYPSSLYDEQLFLGWQCHDKQVVRSDRAMATERLWLSPTIPVPPPVQSFSQLKFDLCYSP
jgi:DNA adenine methylase